MAEVPYQLTREKTEEVVAKLFPRGDINLGIRNLDTQCDGPSCQEIIEAGQRLKSRKAPGPDGLPTECVKLIIKEAPEYITGYAEELMKKKNSFPNKWKEARLVLIPKAGKPWGETGS